jgi:hypothetical protein
MLSCHASKHKNQQLPTTLALLLAHHSQAALLHLCMRAAVLCRLLSSVYGRDWHTPDKRNHGKWVLTEDSAAVVQGLLEKLSVGAWGDMPLSTRQQRCQARSSVLGWRRKP